jgi:hypothetical protein
VGAARPLRDGLAAHPDWAPEIDLERATKVEVRFEDEVDGEGGWPALMDLYAEQAAGA